MPTALTRLLTIAISFALAAVGSLGCFGNAEEMSGNRMREMSLAIVAYASDHRTMPASLEQATSALDMDPSILIHPVGSNVPAPHFLSVRPTTEMPSSQPLIIDNPAAYGGEGSMVVFGDTHAEWVPGTAMWTHAQGIVQSGAPARGVTIADWGGEAGVERLRSGQPVE